MSFKWNPTTNQLDIDNDSGGGGGVVGDTFAPTTIRTGETFTVAPDRQMLTKIPVVIEAGGTLVLGANSVHVTVD